MLHGGYIALISIGAYVVCAAILVRAVPFRRSAVALARKRRVKFPTRLIAHRGGSLIGPENTLHTFQRAISEGTTDVLELDVHETSDKVPVVIHDGELSRLCDSPGVHISSFASTELPVLARKLSLHFPTRNRGAYEDPDDAGSPARRRVCTLRQVFEAFPTTPIHLDVKMTSRSLVTATMDLIDEFDRRRITIVGAASGPNVAQLQKEAKRRTDLRKRGSGTRNPQQQEQQHALGDDGYRSFSSAGQVLSTYVLYYLGLLPFVPLSFDAFSIPLPTSTIRWSLENRPVLRAVLGWFLLSPALWSHLQRRGIVVLGFVISERVDFEEAVHWPIDGIMTDDPMLLRDFFAARDALAPASSEGTYLRSPLATVTKVVR